MEERIAELIAKVQGRPLLPDELHASTNLASEAGLDSLQLINLVLLVETEFNVEVDFNTFELEHLNSLSAFASYIKSLPSNATNN